MVITKDVQLPPYEELEVEEIKLSSPALKAGATHFGKYCDFACKEFMLCRKEEADPRRCLDEGKAVTACGLEFFRKLKQFCYEPFEKYWRCIERKSPEMDFFRCRNLQYHMDDCIRDNIGQDRPQMGMFAQGRVHDSVRPRPQKYRIRDYPKTPQLPEDFPRPFAEHGGAGMFAD